VIVRRLASRERRRSIWRCMTGDMGGLARWRATLPYLTLPCFTSHVVGSECFVQERQTGCGCPVRLQPLVCVVILLDLIIAIM